jgi:hypothetical protein
MNMPVWTRRKPGRPEASLTSSPEVQTLVTLSQTTQVTDPYIHRSEKTDCETTPSEFIWVVDLPMNLWENDMVWFQEVPAEVQMLGASQEADTRGARDVSKF